MQRKLHFTGERILHPNDSNVMETVPILDKNTILHLYDYYDKDLLNKIFSIKGTPGAIISDSISFDLDTIPQGIDVYLLPLWVEREKKKWQNEIFSTDLLETKYCFNFMINRNITSRYICCKMVEQHCKDSNFIYTYSGIKRNFDCSEILYQVESLGLDSPLTDIELTELLMPITLPTTFVITKYTNQNEINIGNNYGRVFYGQDGVKEHGEHNYIVWKNIKNMFFSSGIALITESVDYQNFAHFTEKTLYSVLGLNFPIWVGGYRQADSWKDLGFDTFDDVINHDYQYYPTLLERCVYAIKRNSHLLNNTAYVSDLRNKYLHRLIDNRHKLLGNTIENFVDNIVKNAKPEDESALLAVVNYYRQ